MNEIENYSYYFSDSEDFVKENINNYREMSLILKTVFEKIKDMKKDYNLHLNPSGIMFENKKTKESYSITIEF